MAIRWLQESVLATIEPVPERDGIGNLYSGPSSCLEQSMSAQGRLERVLSAGFRSLPGMLNETTRGTV
jgi:hypothetical protein